MLKNSPNFLALCEGGQPFIIKKEDLKDEGFSDFGWIKSAYSAHPKVDPDNGDIYNIGMSPPMINIMKSTKDMKKIC
jgi:carotenoid cleavage dioxygenase-like enzyme